MKAIRSAFIVVLLVCISIAGFAQGGPGTTDSTAPAPHPAQLSAAELAKKLANPIAAMISVLFQNNFDAQMGSHDGGFRYTLNFQPVIPISLTRNWNLISRTIVSFIDQIDVLDKTSQRGTGDTQQSLIFSPSLPEHLVRGVGPIFLIPSASDALLGTGTFGIGLAMVLLKQKIGWTYGALLNHIWSVAGDDTRSDVSPRFCSRCARVCV